MLYTKDQAPLIRLVVNFLQTCSYNISSTYRPIGVSASPCTRSNSRQLSVCVARCLSYQPTLVAWWWLHSACSAIRPILREAASRDSSALADIVVADLLWCVLSFRVERKKRMLAASKQRRRATQWTRTSPVRQTDGRTDKHQTVALCLPLWTRPA